MCRTPVLDPFHTSRDCALHCAQYSTYIFSQIFTHFPNTSVLPQPVNKIVSCCKKKRHFHFSTLTKPAPKFQPIRRTFSQFYKKKLVHYNFKVNVELMQGSSSRFFFAAISWKNICGYKGEVVAVIINKITFCRHSSRGRK